MKFRQIINGQSTAHVIALIFAVGLMSGCESDEQASESSVETSPAAVVPTQQIFDYRLIESDAGVKQWILESDEMQKFNGQREVVLIRVHMDFFEDGEHFSVLTADSGRADLDNRNVHTWGNVVVITDDGRKLETEDLYFNNETELIHNEVFNRFTREFDVMTGIGLEATPDLEYIELKEDVKAEVDDISAEGSSLDSSDPENLTDPESPRPKAHPIDKP
ncbi:MAG: LPS export ABC transporter protein LptC [Candidatus Krumholzibacteriia bacterium]